MGRISSLLAMMLALGVALAACGDNHDRSRDVGAPWTLVVLPDTQVYSQRYPEIFQAQLTWIARNAAALNVRFVVHVGDVTETNADAEWQVARAAFDEIEGQVPYAIATGNHDYDVEVARTSGLSRWFPPEALRATPTFGGLFEPGRSDNAYYVLSVGRERFLVLTLEWGPRDEVLTWARAVLATHPSHQAIVVTHAYLYNDGSRYDWAQRGASQLWNPHSYSTGPRWSGPAQLNDGQQIWDKLIDDFANVRLVISGHVAVRGVARARSVTKVGGVVDELLANFQDEALGGGGYLRLLRFVDDEIEVRTVSPHLQTELFSAEHSFTLSR